MLRDIGGLRGLDNAGKTTIVKKFNGEAIDTISPTLGFNIKTLEYNGFVILESGGRRIPRLMSVCGLVWTRCVATS